MTRMETWETSFARSLFAKMPKRERNQRGAKQSTFTLDSFQRGCGWPADQGRIILRLDGVATGGSKYDRNNPGKDLPETGPLPGEEREEWRRKGEKSKEEKLEKSERKRERECGSSVKKGKREEGRLRVGAPLRDVSSLLD